MDTIKIDSKGVKIIAHRGLSGLERENTCPAFVAAGNRSYFGIETDVHKTADSKYVIIHDESTERVSGGKHNINVELSDYSAVKDIVLPDLDGSFIRQDIRIPVLSEYVNVCKKYEKIGVLEFKNPFKKEDIAEMIEEIKSLDYINNMIFISFDMANCIYARELLPNAKIQWLVGREINEDDIKTLVDNKLDVDIYYPALTKEIVDNFHSLGMEVNCWTCDSKEDAEKLVEMGVDFITTNILE